MSGFGGGGLEPRQHKAILIATILSGEASRRDGVPSLFSGQPEKDDPNWKNAIKAAAHVADLILKEVNL